MAAAAAAAAADAGGRQRAQYSEAAPPAVNQSMRDWVDRNLDWLGGLLLPPRCVLCGSPRPGAAASTCAAPARPRCRARTPSRCSPGHAPLRRCCAPFAYARSARSPRARAQVSRPARGGPRARQRCSAIASRRSACTATSTCSCRCRCIRSRHASVASTSRRRLQAPGCAAPAAAGRRRGSPRGAAPRLPQVGLHLDGAPAQPARTRSWPQAPCRAARGRSWTT